MGTLGCLIDGVSLRQNLTVDPTVPVVGRDEADATMLMLGIVPSHKVLNPVASCIDVGKGSVWVRWRVLQRTEQGLRVRVVIRDRGTTEGRHYTQMLQGSQHRGALHG